MFSFLKKATPASEVAKVLWGDVVNGPQTRLLCETACEDNEMLPQMISLEIICFMSFAVDLAIHRVFEKNPKLENTLRAAFMVHLEEFVAEQDLTPCPIIKWAEDGTNFCEVLSKGNNSSTSLKNLLDRFYLYASALRRPTVGANPSIIALSTLCNTRSILFVLPACTSFVDTLEYTGKFLRAVPIKP